MPNQYTVTVPMSLLNRKQLLRHIATDLIPSLKETIVSALTDSLTRLGEEVSQQLQQTSEALAGLQAAVDNLSVSNAEKAQLQAQLDEALASIETATAAVNSQADALAADDPQAAEPAPEEVPTPAESTPAESTPAESTPAESTPAEPAPGETTPNV